MTTNGSASGCHGNGDVEERALVARIASGDSTALGILYGRYATPLRGMLRRIVGEESEDLLHEVFLAIRGRAAKYTPERGRVGAWITWMARNLAIDAVRRSRRHAITASLSLLDDLTSPSPRVMLDATKATALLAWLPVEQSSTLRQAFFEGLSYSEIAAREGVPLGTVKSRATRALKAIRGTLTRSARQRTTKRADAHAIYECDTTLRALSA
jgi:RNA polymerase sigma-70 factor (ECF subfamily)